MVRAPPYVAQPKPQLQQNVKSLIPLKGLFISPHSLEQRNKSVLTEITAFNDLSTKTTVGLSLVFGDGSKELFGREVTGTFAISHCALKDKKIESIEVEACTMTS